MEEEDAHPYPFPISPLLLPFFDNRNQSLPVTEEEKKYKLVFSCVS